MEYRRFGKTEKEISVITLGGMRFKHSWDEPRNMVPHETIEQAKTVVQLALKNGINLIETAHGYMKSEHIYGIVLNDELNISRNKYYLMTKGAPETAEQTRELVEEQLKALKTDYFDFYAWHGINNWERFDIALKNGGPVDELLKMKQEGIIKHIGFSTHAPLDIIIKSIETDKFEFVNLHYYYIFQRNIGAIALAESKDMGVFGISPNDKGGQLFKPSNKFSEAMDECTPIQWNARFCLQHPAMHTLSFGLTQPEHFDEMKDIFPIGMPFSKRDREIQHRLDTYKLDYQYSTYLGYDMQNDPSGINIPEVLRLYMLWKCFDMTEFCSYRYNMFEPEHHWFPGNFCTPENVAKINESKIPQGIPVKEMMLEFHNTFYKPKEKK